MKQKNKKKVFGSIKGKIYFFFTLFLIITIALVWIFGVLLLENFYRTVKTSQIRSLLTSVSTSVNDSILYDSNSQKYYSIPDNISNTSLNEEINIYIYKMNDDNTFEYIDKNVSKESMDFIINSQIILEKYQSYLDGGESTFTMNNEFKNDMPSPPGFFNKMNKVTYCSFVEFKSGEVGLVLLTTELVPLNAASKTIAIETIFITIFCFIIMIVLSNIMNKIIAKPLEELTIEAKNLPNKDYDSEFDAKGYDEVEELSNTLNYAKKELRKTEDLQRDLIANVSHELRTPLTLINGYSEMMKDMPSERTDENIEIIINETNRLTNLVNDVLELSKLQSKVLKLKVTDVNIYDICNSVLESFGKYAKEKNFNISYTGDDNIIVEGDNDKLYEVVYNFVANAINYSKDTTEEKNINIVTTIIDNTVKVSVFDEGVGIKSEDLDNIWLRYYKVYDKQKQKSIGSGLGLSIVKEILESHNAKYGVNSVYGEGSEFYFILPIKNNIKEE